MSPRARPSSGGLLPGAVSTTDSVELREGWSLLRTDPEEIEGPSELPDEGWIETSVPGTVASTVGGECGPDDHEDYDRFDWWYRCALPPSVSDATGRVRLAFDGLATLARAWVDDTPILGSSNMFLGHEVDVTDLVEEGGSRLTLVFRSLGRALEERRPRPRWKTRLVDEQKLRWFRTTLLGRIPGWTPAIHAVGPWRSIRLESVGPVDVRDLSVLTRLEDGDGVVSLTAGVETTDSELRTARLRVGDVEREVPVERREDVWVVEGEVRIDEPELWWPRTHGAPVLHDCSLELTTSESAVSVDCGSLGFRTVEVHESDGGPALSINGVPVFCRGACWTTDDLVSLTGDPDRVSASLRRLADANANMVRVGGTMVYETDAFYAECDRLGLMVWQDFMFANMDYPVDDADFAESVTAEARQQVDRLAGHPSVVAFCGGSEVEQQAAMFGAPRDVWTNEFFSHRLPEVVAERSPGTPYWPSTPTGGSLPFRVSEGLTHYYGVGAYRRPLADVRSAGVSFTPECLGFSNVPEPANLRRLGATAPHEPGWKAGVPRDSGAGWDFEDVRDHYLGEMLGLDPVRLRSEDPQRYIRLSRTLTGRVMERVFDEWRSPQNPCAGALVWFLRDIRPGAGWGILDSDGRPKAVYHFLKRAWAPRRLSLLDRGLDGLRVEIHNEAPSPLDGAIEVSVLGPAANVMARGERPVAIAGRESVPLDVEEIVGHFVDPTYSYRFGPLRHAAVEAVFTPGDGAPPLRAVYWSDLSAPLPEIELQAELTGSGGTVGASGLARAVRVELRDGAPDDNYRDLTPSAPMTFSVVGAGDPSSARGFVEAANGREVVRIRAEG